MDHKLGDIFYLEGHKIQVTEVENINSPCDGCILFENNINCNLIEESCMDDAREDHTNVIFKEIKTEEL